MRKMSLNIVETLCLSIVVLCGTVDLSHQAVYPYHKAVSKTLKELDLKSVTELKTWFLFQFIYNFIDCSVGGALVWTLPPEPKGWQQFLSSVGHQSGQWLRQCDGKVVIILIKKNHWIYYQFGGQSGEYHCFATEDGTESVLEGQN